MCLKKCEIVTLKNSNIHGLLCLHFPMTQRNFKAIGHTLTPQGFRGQTPFDVEWSIRLTSKLHSKKSAIFWVSDFTKYFFSKVSLNEIIWNSYLCTAFKNHQIEDFLCLASSKDHLEKWKLCSVMHKRVAKQQFIFSFEFIGRNESGESSFLSSWLILYLCSLSRHSHFLYGISTAAIYEEWASKSDFRHLVK